jgi:hypothetical protein
VTRRPKRPGTLLLRQRFDRAALFTTVKNTVRETFRLFNVYSMYRGAPRPISSEKPFRRPNIRKLPKNTATHRNAAQIPYAPKIPYPSKNPSRIGFRHAPNSNKNVLFTRTAPVTNAQSLPRPVFPSFAPCVSVKLTSATWKSNQGD